MHHVCIKDSEFVAALIVYLSILEQQAKFGDALEILSGNLGSLLMIDIEKLRIQVFSGSPPLFCCLCLHFVFYTYLSVVN